MNTKTKIFHAPVRLNQVTPLHLQIMLHYNGSPYAYGDKNNPEHGDSPAVTQFTADLLAAGFIEETEITGPRFDGKYTATEAGKRWVHSVCSCAAAFAAVLGN